MKEVATFNIYIYFVHKKQHTRVLFTYFFLNRVLARWRLIDFISTSAGGFVLRRAQFIIVFFIVHIVS